jgi:predicted amidophosphoribosyltransferase
MTPIRDTNGFGLDAILERWAGLAMPQAALEMQSRNWIPDARDAYCPKCGVSTTRGEATESGCGSCRGKASFADGIVRLGAYAHDLREWILGVKYRAWAEMGEALGRELGKTFRETGPFQDPSSTLIIPMPMPWPRRMYRGIDHARIIAQGFARECGIPMLSLLAKKNGPPQVSMPVSQRRRSGSRGLNLRSIGDYRPGVRWAKGADLVLVDDVCTTGASLRAATRLLRTLKPRCVIAAVLAVTDDSARRPRAEPMVESFAH